MSARRLRLQIYTEVLQTIHSARQSGQTLNLYRIERTVGLTHVKVTEFLGDLHSLGLLDGGLTITDRGYRFLSDMSGRVLPLLRDYGLVDDGT